MKDLQLQNTSVFDFVKKESERQIIKWGVQDHHPFSWLAIATEEFGEMAKSINECVFASGNNQRVVEEAIQAATLCLKIAEMFLSEDEME